MAGPPSRLEEPESSTVGGKHGWKGDSVQTPLPRQKGYMQRSLFEHKQSKRKWQPAHAILIKSLILCSTSYLAYFCDCRLFRVTASICTEERTARSQHWCNTATTIILGTPGKVAHLKRFSKIIYTISFLSQSHNTTFNYFFYNFNLTKLTLVKNNTNCKEINIFVPTPNPQYFCTFLSW